MACFDFTMLVKILYKLNFVWAEKKVPVVKNYGDFDLEI